MNLDRRVFSVSLASAFATASLGTSAAVRAQTTTTAGSPADAKTVATVKSFVGHFMHLFNNQDPAAVEMVQGSTYDWFFAAQQNDHAGAIANLQAGQKQYLVPAHLFEIDDVLTHGTGQISATVLYSGWSNTVHAYWADIWTLSPASGGYLGLIISDAKHAPFRVANGLKAGKVSTTLALAGMNVTDTNAIPASTSLLLDTVKNTEQTQGMTSGLYLIPEGMPTDQVQQAIAAFNLQAITYIGPTPVRPGKSFQFNFLVQPGDTYAIQAYTWDPTTQNIQIMSGDQFFATFTIAAK